jgi:hypothetical protein
MFCHTMSKPNNLFLRKIIKDAIFLSNRKVMLSLLCFPSAIVTPPRNKLWRVIWNWHPLHDFP